jgi:hypothetical protein
MHFYRRNHAAQMHTVCLAIASLALFCVASRALAQQENACVTRTSGYEEYFWTVCLWRSGGLHMEKTKIVDTMTMIGLTMDNARSRGVSSACLASAEMFMCTRYAPVCNPTKACPTCDINPYPPCSSVCEDFFDACTPLERYAVSSVLSDIAVTREKCRQFFCQPCNCVHAFGQTESC